MDWFRGFFTWLISYYTNWTIMTFFVVSILEIQSLYRSTLLMLLSSSIGGFYITYIHPRKIMVRCFPTPIILEGPLLWVGDFLAHQTPFLYALLNIRPSGSVLFFWVVSLFYFYRNSPQDRYDLEWEEVIGIFLVGQLLAWFVKLI